MLPDDRKREKPVPPANHAPAGTDPGKAVPGKDVTPDPIPAKDPIPDQPPGEPKDPGKPVKADQPPGDAEWTRAAMETHQRRPAFGGPVDPLRKAQADNLKK